MPSQEFFGRKYGLDVPQLFPSGLRAYRQGLVLPLYEKLNENDIFKIVKTLEKEI